MRAKLPISDYINDTKTVLDQVPRLLASMQYIAAADWNAEGSFDLMCQFSRAKQLLHTRTTVRIHGTKSTPFGLFMVV